MKNTKQPLAILILISLFAFGCNAGEGLIEEMQPETAAFSAVVSGSHSTPLHFAAGNACGTARTGKLAMDYAGNSYPLSGTSYLITNSSTHLYLEIKAMPGWAFSEVYLNIVEQGTLLKVDPKGGLDLNEFSTQDIFATHIGWVSWEIPMEDLKKTMTYVMCAKLVNQNNPAQNFTVFFNDAPIINAAGFTTDYTLSVGNCSEACETWIDASNPCAPACSIPELGPGDDHSEFYCHKGNGNKKVTVCHVPPGNPSNMHDICISEQALPAHVIDFKPVGDECMGHHSGCHLGPCDPCGAGSSQTSIDAASAFKIANGCN